MTTVKPSRMRTNGYVLAGGIPRGGALRLAVFLAVLVMVYPFGADADDNLGATGLQATPNHTKHYYEVTTVEAGSPADGKIQVGDRIVGTNGKLFSTDQYKQYGNTPKLYEPSTIGWFVLQAPRREFADALEAAQTSNGQFVLDVLRGDQSLAITLSLPVKQPFGATYPWKCPRSTALLNAIRQQVETEYLTDINGMNDLLVAHCGLFLLAVDPVGYADELNAINAKVFATINNGRSGDESAGFGKKGSHGSWIAAYTGLYLSEYSLAHGSPAEIQPYLQQTVELLLDSMQPFGLGWGHYYGAHGYSHHRGSFGGPGVLCAYALHRLRDAGAKVNPALLNKLVDTMAGLIEPTTGRVVYAQHMAVKPGLDLNTILSKATYRAENNLNGDSLMRQAITSLLMNNAGRDACTVASIHYLSRLSILPERTHGIDYEWGFVWGAIALQHSYPERFRVFLDRMKPLIALDERWSGGIIPRTQTPSHQGITLRIPPFYYGLLLALPQQKLKMMKNGPAASLFKRIPKTGGKHESGSHLPEELVVLGDKVYYAGNDGSTKGRGGLWKCDPVTNRQRLVAGGFGLEPQALFAWPEKGVVLFSALEKPNEEYLYVTNGRTATKLVANPFHPPYHFVKHGKHVYFIAQPPGSTSAVLWKTDGKAAGTVVVSNSIPLWYGNVWNQRRSHASPAIIKAFNRLYMIRDPDAGGGLVRSDGTAANTTVIADDTVTGRITGSVGSGCKFHHRLHNDKLYFGAEKGLFRVDDANSAPVKIGDCDWAGDIASVNGKLVFSATDTGRSISAGDRLFVSDGVTTRPLGTKNLPGWSRPLFMTSINNKVVFAAVDGKHGQELWVTDGTDAGTVLLKDICPGSMGSLIGPMVVLDGKAWFNASDGSHGMELWCTDGTAAGTVSYDLLPGPEGSCPRKLFTSDGKLYFHTKAMVAGKEIWRIDPDGKWQKKARSDQAALKKVLAAKEYKFTRTVRAAYLTAAKSQARAALAYQNIPKELFTWIDSKPIVEATVYGAHSKPSDIILHLYSLQMDLGKHNFSKYCQLALAEAVVNAKQQKVADITPRKPLKLVIPGDPREPVNTRDPRRTLDKNDHIINFLNDNKITAEVISGQEESELIYDDRGQAISQPKKHKKKSAIIRRSLYACDVIASRDLQKKFNDYMASKGHDVTIDCGDKVVHWNARDAVKAPIRKKIAEAFDMFHEAYKAKGLMPKERDPFPTPGEQLAFLIRNYEYNFKEKREGAQTWPKFPLRAPWPALVMLTSHDQPLRESQERWDAFSKGGIYKTYGEYIGGIAQQFDMQSARRIKPFPFTYGTVQMALKDGGVCGTMAGISTESKTSLGIPAVNAAQPGHCALVYYDYDTKTDTYSCEGEQYATGGHDKTTPFSGWFFGRYTTTEDWYTKSQRSVYKEMVYHQSVAWAVNYGMNEYMDSLMALTLYKELSEDEKKEHGIALLKSGLGINPYSFALVDAMQELANTPQQQIETWNAYKSIMASAKSKPGCPKEGLYNHTVQKNMFTKIAKLPVPDNKSVVSEVYEALKSEGCENSETLAKYMAALEQVPDK